jgi:RNA polymerase sigma factor (sigma-70 family)
MSEFMPPRRVAATKHNDERGLLDAARHGDGRAFETLVANHMATHLRYASYLTYHEPDAEDLLMRAYEIAWSKITTTAVKRFDPWVCRILLNLALNLWRARRGDRTVSITADDGTTFEIPDEREDFGVVEDSLYAREIMGALEPWQREVLRLRFVEDLTFREMGERFGISKQSAEQRTKQAIASARTVARDGADTDW